MNKMYLVNNRVSETPVYWIARYTNNVVNQINDLGEICEKWSTLPLDNLEYWGIITNVGHYGFYPKDNICDINGEKLRFESSLSGKLSYKRTILSSSDGWTSTKSVEIGFFEHTIKLTFLPKLNIVLSIQQKITGDEIEDLELKTSDY